MILEVVISNSHFIIISMCITMGYVIDTIQVFLPKCPLTTVSAEEVQIVRDEAQDTLEEKTSTGI